jgi:hypothetical protein
MSDTVKKLEEQISPGKIVFDAGSETKLKNELLQKNDGTRVTERLQELVLELSKLQDIRISSLIRDKRDRQSAGA